jgi:hypothetical protein
MKMKSKLKIPKKSKGKHSHQKTPSTEPERRFGTMRLERRERITVSEYLDRCLIVIQNHGPGKIGVDAGSGDLGEIMPGKLLAKSAAGRIDVESRDDWAVIELRFIPTAQ